MLDVLTQIENNCAQLNFFVLFFREKLKDTKIKFTSHKFIEHKITTFTQITSTNLLIRYTEMNISHNIH